MGTSEKEEEKEDDDDDDNKEKAPAVITKPAPSSVLEMEEELLGSVAGNKAHATGNKGKKGKQPKAPKAAAAIKRPAAAIKRPAAAVVDIKKIKPKIIMDDVFDKLRASGRTVDRNTFACRAYDNAKRRMTNKGADMDTASIVARYYHASASKLYDELA